MFLLRTMRMQKGIFLTREAKGLRQIGMPRDIELLMFAEPILIIPISPIS